MFNLGHLAIFLSIVPPLCLAVALRAGDLISRNFIMIAFRLQRLRLPPPLLLTQLELRPLIVKKTLIGLVRIKLPGWLRLMWKPCPLPCTKIPLSIDGSLAICRVKLKVIVGHRPKQFRVTNWEAIIKFLLLAARRNPLVSLFKTRATRRLVLRR